MVGRAFFRHQNLPFTRARRLWNISTEPSKSFTPQPLGTIRGGHLSGLPLLLGQAPGAASISAESETH